MLIIENDKSRQVDNSLILNKSTESSKGGKYSSTKSYNYVKKLATASFYKVKHANNCSVDKQPKTVNKSRMASSQEKAKPGLKDCPPIISSAKFSST